MARKANLSSPKSINLWTTDQVVSYLEALVATGVYGKSVSDAAERLVTEGLTRMLRDEESVLDFSSSMGRFSELAEQQQPEAPRRNQIFLAPATQSIPELLRTDPTLIYQLSAQEFEDLVHDRLQAIGFDVARVGRANTPDGGVDMIACPKVSTPYPFLLAVQAKHHRSSLIKVGSAPVRDLFSLACAPPFHAGLLVTNTSFTPDAQWFAQRKQGILKLRGLDDIIRWLDEDVISDEEWREIPGRIELRPGLTVELDFLKRSLNDGNSER